MSTTRFPLALVAVFSFMLSGGSALLYGQSSTRAGGGVQYAAPSDADLEEKTSRVFPASWPSLALPKVTLPKITMPTITMPRWPKLWPSAEDGDGSSPALLALAPVAAGARKITSGAKKAWQGTKDILSLRGRNSKSPKRNGGKPKPSLWERMVTPAEPTYPRTMSEWMSQPRSDP